MTTFGIAYGQGFLVLWRPLHTPTVVLVYGFRPRSLM